jgi:hypothetical protein
LTLTLIQKKNEPGNKIIVGKNALSNAESAIRNKRANRFLKDLEENQAAG